MEKTTTSGPNFIPTGPDQQLFDTLRNELRAEIAPQGVLEEEVFRILVQAAWNRRRVQVLLDGLRQKPDVDPLVDPASAKQHDRLTQYETRYERAFYKAMKELGALQTTRALRDRARATQPEVELPASPVVDAARILRRPPKPIDATDRAIQQIEQEALALMVRSRIRRLETEAAALDAVAS